MSTASNNRNAQPLTYMGQLDSLRAIAACSVVVMHYRLTSLPLAGLGVQLFFVLSGFLITSILMDGRELTTRDEAGPFHVLRQFYIRRFLRIFPLYYLTLAWTVYLAVPGFRESMPYSALYLTNVFMYLKQTWIGFASHFWTLAVEEQFYLFWPFLVLFVPRRFLPLSILGITMVSPIIRLAYALNGQSAFTHFVNLQLPLNMESLGAGALLAVLLQYHEHKNALRWFLRICLWVGLPSFLLVAFRDYTGLNRYLLAYIFCTGSALFFTWVIHGASRGFHGAFGWLLNLAPIRWCGRISYGIYVYHFIMEWMAPKACEVLHLPATLGQNRLVWIAGTLIVSTLSWHLFEKPINNYKRHFPYRAAGTSRAQTGEGPGSLTSLKTRVKTA